MKKALVVLLTILILTASIFCFAGCDKNPEKIATLTLLNQDGSEIGVVELDKGSYINTISTPKKEGYIFSGWYTSPEAINDETIEPLKDTFKIEGDMTLYAKWEEATPLGDKMMIGLQAAVIGIGMVFLILAILVLVIMATKYIVNPVSNKKAKEDKKAPAPQVTTDTDEEITEELVAVITAAISATMNNNTEAPKANFVVRSIKRIR